MVSIHAPVKGATRAGGSSTCLREVSIHAPVKGATHVGAVGQPVAEVSIHAPVKGATPCVAIHPRPSRSFNPRAREGRDHEREDEPSGTRSFQSTRP